MNIVDMVEALSKDGLHDICFRNAGVGLLFYDPPEGFEITQPTLKEAMKTGYRTDNSWRQYLSVQKYYPTFTEAVKGEYDRRIVVQ